MQIFKLANHVGLGGGWMSGNRFFGLWKSRPKPTSNGTGLVTLPFCKLCRGNIYGWENQDLVVPNRNIKWNRKFPEFPNFRKKYNL